MRNITANIVLSRAARRLEQKGHCKGAMMKMNGKTCAAGALLAAKYNVKDLKEMEELENSNAFRNVILRSAARKIGKVLGRTWYTIFDLVDWNDSRKTTKKEVISTFKKAIKVK